MIGNHLNLMPKFWKAHDQTLAMIQLLDKYILHVHIL